MEFKNLDYDYILEAVELANYNYQIEVEKVASLYNKTYKEELYKNLYQLFKNNNGVMAIDDNKLIAYLAFGNIHKTQDARIMSVSSPIHGYGIGIKNRGKLSSILFQCASEKLCKNKVGQYQVTLYAHDIEVISSYALNQFGILCTDTIRDCNKPIIDNIITNENIQYKELNTLEIKNYENQLLCLYRKLVKHLQMSPIYYPGREFSDKLYLDYIRSNDIHIFVAIHKDKIIGMIDASNDGNNFISNEIDTFNLGSLYLDQEYRGKNIAKELLSFTNDTLKKIGAKRLWVEHGTANPTARGFWDTYFDNFTYTLTREIDSSMLG